MQDRVPRNRGSYISRRGTTFVRLLPLLAVLIVPAVLAALAMWPGAGVAHAAKENGQTVAALTATRTPTPLDGGSQPDQTTSTPSPSPVAASTPVRWERQALRDLAEVLEWPPVVSQDASGRLMVQRVVSSSERSAAIIRPFEFHAGAEAAFLASLEDTRISGYSVAEETFFSYPAYFASLTDGHGQLYERRFYWLADQWIMGVELKGESSSLDPRAIGQQLLVLAVQYGLPAPPGGVIPTPTHGLGATPSVIPPQGTSTPVPCNIEFVDVPPASWAYSFITQLACQGVVSGYGDGTFRPQYATTRGQLVKMLVLAEGWTVQIPSTPTFSDVGVSHTFYRYIETAYAKDVVGGYADGTFRPDDLVTRAQVAKMVVGARGWALDVATPANLCDVRATHWASVYVQAAIARGIFTGYGDGCFYPDAPATRAQLAKVLVLAHR
jgi:hypothetical protein